MSEQIIYDAILFGNGMSLNLISQLKPLIPRDKHYLTNIDDFLRCFLANQLTPRENNIVYSSLYKKCTPDNTKYFEKLKIKLQEYYDLYDSNIEHYLGLHLFSSDSCGYDYPLIKSLFPMLYNTWHQVLIGYISHLNLCSSIDNFSKSVGSHLTDNAGIFTTNFDCLLSSLSPQHIHGRFVTDSNAIGKLVYKQLDDNEFYYKCVWGWNGIGKLNLITALSQYTDHKNYFDFDFFFDDSLNFDHILLFGLSFQTSGYIVPMAKHIPKYNDPHIGGILDEHILMRLHALQSSDKLGSITFSYFSDRSLTHYQKIAEHYKLKNISYKHTSEFNFSF